MALNFGLLDTSLPEKIAGSYYAGQQQRQQNELAAQQAAMRQQELGMRQQEFGMRQQEVAQLAQERQAKLQRSAENQKLLTNLSGLMEQNGDKLNRPTLSAMLRTGLQTNQSELVQIATKGLQALDDNEQFEGEMARIAPTPAAPAAANALAPAAQPAATAAPTNALASSYTKPQIEFMLRSSNPRMREMGGKLLGALPKEATPSNLARLQAEKAALPPGDPRHAAYDAAIAKETQFAPAAPTTLSRLQAEMAALPPGDPRLADYMALIKKETTHAPGTTVSVTTEKKYGEQFAGKMADVDIGKMTAAEKAPELAANANRVLDILNKGNVFTGSAADIKLNVARALNLAGANNDESIANTEMLVSGLARNTLGAVKSSGLGAGQGFTDKDLKFLQDAEGGRITLNQGTLKQLAELSYKAAESSASAWNKRVKELPRSAAEGTGLSTSPIEIPKRPAVVPGRTGAPAVVRPAGVGANWTFERDAAGNTAWVSPDRKSFKEAK